MKNIELNERFISFEKENNLFDLRDNNGFYVWDIIRFDIYVNLMWNYKSNVPIKPNYNEVFKRTFFRIAKIVQYLKDNKHSDNFFYLSSRNKIHGKLFDQNAYDVVNSFDADTCCFFESNGINRGELLFNTSVYSFLQLYQRKLHKSSSYFDYSIIVEQIKQIFGSCPFGPQQIQLIVDSFFSDVAFFTKLLMRKKVKRVFVTQNGLQKGLFFAARLLGIPTFEFQHGIVDKGHLAYHYPELPLRDDQVYLPNNIFSFSEFWFKELHVPNVKIWPLGNNFMAKKIAPLETHITSIIIVSANIYGTALAEFLITNITLIGLRDRSVYFKLHPNQFHEKEYYVSAFEKYPNITVITDDYSISEILERCQILFTIQSTAVYEALQAGRKVILLNDGTYKRAKDLLTNPDLYFVENGAEFEYAINAPVKNTQGTTFFAEFNPDVLNKALSNV